MTEVYNIRVGDMIWNFGDGGSTIMGVVYKLTPKYVYYALCARNNGNPVGDHYITKDHRVSKELLYKYIREDRLEISYAQGTNRRRKIKENAEGG